MYQAEIRMKITCWKFIFISKLLYCYKYWAQNKKTEQNSVSWLSSILGAHYKLLAKTYNIPAMHQVETVKINEIDKFVR